jgi:hypothetical protein
MHILERNSDIENAQSRFAAQIRALAGDSIKVSIGFQSGSANRVVDWLPNLGIWAFFGKEPPFEKSPGLRYWNVFGVGKPKPNQLTSIVCEINFPKHGINERVAGAFVIDSSGSISIAHRGNFNARGRIPFEFARRNFDWEWTLVNDGDRHTEVMIIGSIGTTILPQRLRDFVLRVRDFKETARSRPWLK